jgi:hypothetical protein
LNVETPGDRYLGGWKEPKGKATEEKVSSREMFVVYVMRPLWSRIEPLRQFEPLGYGITIFDVLLCPGDGFSLVYENH